VPSRIRKSRDASSGSADHYRANGAAASAGEPSTGAFGVPGNGVAGNGSAGAGSAPVAGELGAGSGDPGDQQQANPQGRMLRNWRVRSRLVLLITIPTATAVALGGASIISSWQSAIDDQRTEVLANMSTKITQLAYQLEAERDAIVWYIAAGRVVGMPAVGSTSYDQLVLAKQLAGYT
jgi:hypothetical protein